LKKSIFSPFLRKILSHIHDYLGKHISIISLLLHRVSTHVGGSIPKIKPVCPLVDFYGSSLEKVDFSPFARKVLSHIHDYLGKCISIISLLLHRVSTHVGGSIPKIKSV
jgi:hypothetical protein